MEVVHPPGVSHQNGDALSRRPCEREEEKVICRQRKYLERESRNRAIRVITRRQRRVAGGPESASHPSRVCEPDFSPTALRAAQRSDGCLKTILELLDVGSEKPPWSTVERADPEAQQIYDQWEILQLKDVILYRNFLNIYGEIR